MVVNGGGGMSTKEVTQILGRVLRKTETKDTAKMIDFMDVKFTDCSPFGRQPKGHGSKHGLHKQSLKRWEIYEELGWEPKLK